jgi:hypothetical protein
MIKDYEGIRNHHKKRVFRKITIIFIIAIILGITTAVTYYYHYKVVNMVTDSISYQSSGLITPIVCLKDNDFISNECSSEDKSYVSSLIDKIILNYTYSLVTDKDAYYDYYYKITLTTKANEKGDTSKPVYNEGTILDEQSGTVDSTKVVAFNRKYDIDFPYYNNLISEFKRDYVLALDSKLNINVYMSMTGHYGGEGETRTKEHNIDIIVPLSEQTVNIDRTNLSFGTSEEFTAMAHESSQQILFQRIISIVDAIYLVFMVFIIIKIVPKESVYNKKLKRILNEYDRAIVKTNNLPELANYKLIYVASFLELLDAKESLNEPILFSEGKHHDSAHFVILNGDEAYIYYFDAYGEGLKNEK